MCSRKVFRFLQRNESLKVLPHEECKQQHWIIVAQFTVWSFKRKTRRCLPRVGRAFSCAFVGPRERESWSCCRQFRLSAAGERAHSYNVNSPSIRWVKFSCWVDWSSDLCYDTTKLLSVLPKLYRQIHRLAQREIFLVNTEHVSSNVSRS